MGKYKLTTEQYNKLIEFSVKRERVDEGIGDLIGSALGLGWKASKGMWNAAGMNQKSWVKKINNAVDYATKSENELLNIKDLNEYKELIIPVIKTLEDFSKVYLKKLKNEKKAYKTFTEKISDSYGKQELIKLKGDLPRAFQDGDRIDLYVIDYFKKRKKLGTLTFNVTESVSDNENQPKPNGSNDDTNNNNTIRFYNYMFESDKYTFDSSIKSKHIKFNDNKNSITIQTTNFLTPTQVFEHLHTILINKNLYNQTLNWYYSFNRISKIYVDKAKNIYDEFITKVNKFMDEFDDTINDSYNRDNNKESINEGIFDVFKSSEYKLLKTDMGEISKAVDNSFIAYNSKIKKTIYNIITPYRGIIKKLDKNLKNIENEKVNQELRKALLTKRVGSIEQQNQNKRK